VQYTIILKGIINGDNKMNQKYFFLFALIITLLVFNLGIFMGYMLENSRVAKINQLSLDSQMELLDQMTQKNAINLLNPDCKTLIEENTKFGDKIFREAQQISKYEEANELGKEIITQHKRFDLLRALFWMNSIEIKQKCNSDYHNVIYFYQYNSPSIEQKSKQAFFSNILAEIKEAQGSNMMLIPISADNDITSINLLISKYNITEFPSVLIDEKVLITEINSSSEIEKYLN
jgi:hypothetical protein